MSAKTTKRRQKRLNTNEEEDLTEKSDKKGSPKKIDEEPKEIITIEDDSIKEEPKKEETEEQNGCKGFDAKEIDKNGETEKIKETEEKIINNGQHEPEKQIDEATDKTVEIEEEIEALVVVDSESEYENSQSEIKETEGMGNIDSSPVLTNRGMTRRSQTKNTENGMGTNVIKDLIVNVTRLQDVIETDEDIELEKDIEIEEIDDKTEEKLENDVTNSSIFVNMGNDTTKNFDFTSTSVLEETVSNSFVEINKDVSYGEALRNLTGRRTLRGRDRYNKSTDHHRDLTDSSRKSYIPHISSVKRKGLSDSSDEAKRFKMDEDSPGLLSYISSPLNSFRNKVSRSELPSSTPKLTSFKYGSHQVNNVMDDVSQIESEENTEAKKWCSIM